MITSDNYVNETQLCKWESLSIHRTLLQCCTVLIYFQRDLELNVSIQRYVFMFRPRNLLCYNLEST